MAPGKARDDEKDVKPEIPTEKKPEAEGDPLAELIDNYAEEIEPVAPGDDAGSDPEKA